MNKFKTYIVFGFLSAMIGAAIEIISAILNFRDSVIMSELIESMAKGVFIGVASLFFLFHIFMKFKNKPIAGFITNFAVVAVLMTFITVYDYIKESYSFPNNRWIFAIIAAQVLSFLLTAVWYRQMNRYNDMLGKKKAAVSVKNLSGKKRFL